MKVILLEDVKKVGKKGEVVNVADGYARNFLIAKKLAVMASNTSMSVLDEQNKEKAIQDKENKEKAEAKKIELEKKEIIFKVNAKDGKVFNSISTKQIADELIKEGFEIDKRKFIDKDGLTQLGYNKVKVELYKGVIATLKIKLIEE